MTEQTNLGLKSINDRLTQLEKIKDVYHEDDFLDKLKSATIQTSLTKQKNQITQIKDHYTKGLAKNVNDISMNMFTYIVEYTINYVEKNINVIAYVLDSKVSGQLKLHTAITFICEYFTDLDKKFIENSINHMVDIVFNRKNQDLSKISSEALDVSNDEKKNKMSTLTKRFRLSYSKK